MTINMSERRWQKTGARARELVTPWGTLTKSHGVQRVSLLGRSMEVRSTELEDGVRFTDDLGGDRVQQYGMFPEAGCGPATEANLFCESLGLHRMDDIHGPLAEVLRDERGYPVGVRYGETLVALYHFNPADLAQLGEASVVPEWIELIDTRTGGAILDTRLFEDAPAMPWFIVLAGGLSIGSEHWQRAGPRGDGRTAAHGGVRR